jgi:hypothetical protein
LCVLFKGKLAKIEEHIATQHICKRVKNLTIQSLRLFGTNTFFAVKFTRLKIKYGSVEPPHAIRVARLILHLYGAFFVKLIFDGVFHWFGRSCKPAPIGHHEPGGDGLQTGGRKQQNDPRGARHQARSSRHKLVFGRSVRIGTMMQSCASAAKLRGGGPILNRGSKTMCKVGLPPPRSVICSSASIRERTAEAQCSQASHVAGRRSRPARTSPVVTNRQSAMMSFRASATIIVLRVPPRASAVRFRYHSANTLSF